MFNLSNILKEAKWIGKISLLQEMQMKNMVGQLFAKHKDKIAPENVNKEKEKFLNFANKINDKVVKNLKVDFKNEKIVLVWILEQIFLNVIDEDRLEEDLNIIKENLEIYFKNKGVINKPLERINYSELKEIIKDYKEGGEEAEHQEFLSKPLYEGNSYKIYKITEVDQCLKIGKGTSWCIQGEDYAKKYLEEGPLYLVTKNNKRFGLLSFETAQFMDVNDEELEDNIIKEIFKVFPKEVFNKLILISLKKLSKLIKYIENPSEEVQLEAVKQNGYSIQFIENPSKKVQLEAVKQNGYSIDFIKNPDKEMQIAAIKNITDSIQFIENPSEEAQLEAIRRLAIAIKYIENPSEEAQLEAVKRYKPSIKYIKNPTQKVLDYVESLKK